MSGPTAALPWRPPSLALTRILFLGLPVLAALGPLVTLHGGVFAYRIVCVGIVGYAVVFLMARSRWQPPDVWLALTVASVVVTGLLGLPILEAGADNPYSEFASVVLGLSTALAVRAWQRMVPGLYGALARGWVAAGLLSCVIAVLEIQTGRHLPGYLVAAAPQPAATFGNPNALATFLVMANLWAIAVRREGGIWWRVATWVLALASFPVLTHAGARLALAAWLVLVLWSVWQAIRSSRDGLARIAEMLVPLAVAGGLLLLLRLVYGYAGEIGTAGSSGGVRAALTRYGLEIALERRGLPTGPGSFEALIAPLADPAQTLGLVNAHNIWVEILVQYGFMTLLLFLGWIIACLVSVGRGRPEAWLGAVVLVVVGMIDSSLLDDSSMWAFVITLAALTRTRSPAPDGVREARLVEAGAR